MFLTDRDTKVLDSTIWEFDNLICEVEDLNDEKDYRDEDGGVYEYYTNLNRLSNGIRIIINKIHKQRKIEEIK